MPYDPFADLLDGQPLSRLSTLRERILKSIADSQEHLKAVDRAIEKKRANAAQSSGRSSKGRGSKGRKRVDRRELIDQIIQTNPTGQWLPFQIEERLAAMGHPASRDAVRQTMRRMIDEDRLRRHPSGHGVTGLASTNGSGGESSIEATDLGPEPTRAEAGTT